MDATCLKIRSYMYVDVWLSFQGILCVFLDLHLRGLLTTRNQEVAIVGSLFVHCLSQEHAYCWSQ